MARAGEHTCAPSAKLCTTLTRSYSYFGTAFCTLQSGIARKQTPISTYTHSTTNLTLTADPLALLTADPLTLTTAGPLADILERMM